MKCPFCANHNTQVLDSRLSDEGEVVRRRRRCCGCEKRFTTYERAELRLPQVIKRNGAREAFDVDKLSAGFSLALRKRPVSAEAVDRSIVRVQEKLITLGVREVDAREVGEMVMTELLTLDKIAWIRFASVYQNFDDTASFLRAIADLESAKLRDD